jgi:hypothetical protein
VNEQNDSDNCGGCGNPCTGSTAYCIAGACAAFDTTDLIGSWKFDEIDGTTAADSSPSDNTGTVYGVASFVSGKIGNALSFDGKTAYVETTNIVEENETAYSIGAWFKTSATDLQVIFANRGVTATTGQSLTLTIGSPSPGFDAGGEAAGAIYWVLDNDGFAFGVQSDDAYNDGTWHYVVATWAAPTGTSLDSGQFSLYVDGAGPISTTEFVENIVGFVQSPVSGYQAAQIGTSLAWSSNGTPSYFHGLLDEVTVWSRELAASDVQALYNGGAGLSVP